MILETLRLVNFRNIAETTIAFSPGINVIQGANGQGKSNLLEAIGLIGSGRSFRRASPDEMRRLGSPWFCLQGKSQAQGLRHGLEFFGQPGKQAARLDGKALPALSAMGAALTTVVCAPETMRLLQAGPSERRNYLDWLTFCQHRGHAASCREWQTALQSRNILLRQERMESAEMAAWEDRLAVIGAGITWQRRQTVGRLQRHLTPFLPLLGLAESAVECPLVSQVDRSQPNWQETEQVAAGYRRLLASNRESDRRHGCTGFGPHRDDWALRLGGKPMLDFASQGQKKRFLLALKLAEGSLLQEILGEPPVFLLDDPAAEMDPLGMELLTSILLATGAQTVIAACDPATLPRFFANVPAWSVRDGVFALAPIREP